MENTLSKALLEWYQNHARVLPWRSDATPYHVLLSEIMLQQTRVDTVVPYYLRFIDRFPTFRDLAEADEAEVLLLWQGLGYYSRARNLHRAAKEVVSTYGGDLPRDKDSLLHLSGVGPYVSSAVRAIAFNEKDAAVDGNLIRVYARLNAAAVDVTSAKTKTACGEYFLAHMEQPSSFNQALMDLGELICLPHGVPLCDKCPLKQWCKAFQQGNPLDYPPPKKKNEVRQVRLSVLLVTPKAGYVAIHKRPDNGLLAGLYEFPNVEGKFTLSALRQRFPSLEKIQKVGVEKHRFSHILWTMDVYRCEGDMPNVIVVPMREVRQKYSLPTAFAKLLPYLED